MVQQEPTYLLGSTLSALASFSIVAESLWIRTSLLFPFSLLKDETLAMGDKDSFQSRPGIYLHNQGTKPPHDAPIT